MPPVLKYDSLALSTLPNLYALRQSILGDHEVEGNPFRFYAYARQGAEMLHDQPMRERIARECGRRRGEIDGDIDGVRFLLAVRPDYAGMDYLLRDEGYLGFHCADRLGEDAYWRKDLEMLSLCRERIYHMPTEPDAPASPAFAQSLLCMLHDRLAYNASHETPCRKLLPMLPPERRSQAMLDIWRMLDRRHLGVA